MSSSNSSSGGDGNTEYFCKNLDSEFALESLCVRIIIIIKIVFGQS